MVNHSQVLPECEKEHSTMWKFFYGTAGFFITFLAITTPIVIANVNDLRESDIKIRQQQTEYEVNNEQVRAKIGEERMRQFAEVYKKIDAEFTDVKVQLARIQSTLEHSRQ
jgi:hypothetical protein